MSRASKIPMCKLQNVQDETTVCHKSRMTVHLINVEFNYIIVKKMSKR